MEVTSGRTETKEKRLLAFVVSEEHNVISLHVDKDGIDILMRPLQQRIKENIEKDECEHEHLMSEEWGGWEFSISDEADKGKVNQYIKST